MSELRPADPYEAQYMEGALYRDKSVAPLSYHLVFLLPALISVLSFVFAHAPLPLLVLPLAILAIAWLLFISLRISVTAKELVVQYGLFGPTIPIASIQSCEAIHYDWKKYGGWGIRYGRDGSVAYNMLGDQGRAVRILYRTGDKTRTLLLSTRDPERLAQAIQKARGTALPEPEARLRIEEPAEHAISSADAEEQEEAHAALITNMKR